MFFFVCTSLYLKKYRVGFLGHILPSSAGTPSATCWISSLTDRPSPSLSIWICDFCNDFLMWNLFCGCFKNSLIFQISYYHECVNTQILLIVPLPNEIVNMGYEMLISPVGNQPGSGLANFTFFKEKYLFGLHTPCIKIFIETVTCLTPIQSFQS